MKKETEAEYVARRLDEGLGKVLRKLTDGISGAMKEFGSELKKQAKKKDEK